MRIAHFGRDDGDSDLAYSRLLGRDDGKSGTALLYFLHIEKKECKNALQFYIEKRTTINTPIISSGAKRSREIKANRRKVNK